MIITMLQCIRVFTTKLTSSGMTFITQLLITSISFTQFNPTPFPAHLVSIFVRTVIVTEVSLEDSLVITNWQLGIQESYLLQESEGNGEYGGIHDGDQDAVIQALLDLSES